MTTKDFRLANLDDADPDTWPLLGAYIERAGKLADPDWTFSPYAEMEIMGDLNPKGFGFSSATWKWNILQDWQREALRGFCPSPALSAQVYIRTPTNETISGARVWKNFLADMWWPLKEDKQDGSVSNFMLEFRNLVEVS